MKQGALGDCWLVAAMATLAGTMPGTIKKLFVNSERSYRQEQQALEGCSCASWPW